MANSLGQVFSMYRNPTFATPRTNAKLKMNDLRREKQRQTQDQGLALGEIAELKMMADGELSPSEGLVQDQSMSMGVPPQENVMTPEQSSQIDLYKRMGQAGFADTAMDQIFPKANNNNMAQKQFAMSQMAGIDADMSVLGQKYNDAVTSGNTELANELFNQANGLRQEFAKHAFGVNQKPRSWKIFEQKAVDKSALGNKNAQLVVNEAYQSLKAGEITQDEYDEIYYNQNAQAKANKGKVENVGGEIQKDQLARAEADRKARMHELGLGEAENSIFQKSLDNLRVFKTVDALDAYNKYLPTLDSEYKEALAGKAGAQRAIVVAYNKLIEPSSAVMEGDFRSSGMSDIASTGAKLGDAKNAVMSGNYDQLGRRLSEAEIKAIYESGKRIAQGLRGSVVSRVNKEEQLLKDKLARGGFTYKPNTFSNYIGFGSNKKAKLNPADYSNLGAYKKAGGTNQAWFKAQKEK